MAERLSRRTFLALGASIVAGACSPGDSAPATTSSEPASTSSEPPAPTEPPASQPTAVGIPPATTTAIAPPTTAPLATDPFTLGVTAGDPDERSAVLWTRLLADQPLPEEVPVVWELAADPEFSVVVSSGDVAARAVDGHSVHVTVDLDGPAWYRFRAGGWTSPAGRVAPTPAGDAGRPLRIATASCQNFETGFYAAHRDIADWQPDLVLFLGDFIYEYASRPVGPERVRSHAGREPTGVEGYRARYAQYLADPDLQAARAACPWLVIWDDHEVDNNYAGLVPEERAGRAGFSARRAAAYQVWWEHMPVRLPPPHRGDVFAIHRRVRWGELADVLLLDGRQYRSDQACADVVLDTGPPCPEALDPARSMLGGRQERWVGEQFAAATATWTVLGQQTVVTDLRLPNGAILSHDQWDGYAPARERLLDAAGAVDRLVVLTGDIHLGAVASIPGIGVEFVTSAISSANEIGAVIDPATFIGLFPAVVDAELGHRGYTRHTVDVDHWTAEYRIVENAMSADSPVTTWRTFRVEAARPDAAVAV